MDDRGSSGIFLSGLLIGAIVGVAIGMIFAPQSGKETRELVREKVSTAKEKADELIQKARKP